MIGSGIVACRSLEMNRRFHKLAPEQKVLDKGCGSGPMVKSLDEFCEVPGMNFKTMHSQSVKRIFRVSFARNACLIKFRLEQIALIC